MSSTIANQSTEDESLKTLHWANSSLSGKQGNAKHNGRKLLSNHEEICFKQVRRNCLVAKSVGWRLKGNRTQIALC